jgi:hypothetical protein
MVKEMKMSVLKGQGRSDERMVNPIRPRHYSAREKEVATHDLSQCVTTASALPKPCDCKQWVTILVSHAKPTYNTTAGDDDTIDKISCSLPRQKVLDF